LNAANTYCSGHPNLSGISFNPTLIYAPGASNLVTFSLDGAAILPDTIFTATTNQTNPGGYWEWGDFVDEEQIWIRPADQQAHHGMADGLGVYSGAAPVPTTPVVAWIYPPGVVPGVTLNDNGTITFTNAVVPEDAGVHTSLRLNGHLTIPH
jgi:hypothetical protein